MKFSHLLSFALSLLLVQCSDLGTPVDVSLDSSIDGKTAHYPVGARFSIELDLHADSGYLWDCNISDTTVVRTDGATSYRPKDPTIAIGGMIVATFHFQAHARGHSTITLTELRVWERNIPPLNIVRFDVDVK